MAVNIQRGRNIGVAEPDRNILDRKAHIQQIRGRGMTQVMQTDFRKAGFFEKIFELTGEIGGLDYCAVLFCTDILLRQLNILNSTCTLL